MEGSGNLKAQFALVGIELPDGSTWWDVELKTPVPGRARCTTRTMGRYKALADAVLAIENFCEDRGLKVRPVMLVDVGHWRYMKL